MEQKQQKLREWILKNDYIHLNPEKDGMTAWEIAGMILKVIEPEIIYPERNESNTPTF